MSQAQLKPLAVGLWIFGLMIQTAGFVTACADRWVDRQKAGAPSLPAYREPRPNSLIA
jgi:hypothetical protein